jgi:hypothetical protein
MASDSYLIHHVFVCQRGPRQSAKRQQSIISCRRCHLSRASSSSPQLLLLHVCIKTSGECVPVQAVCQRGCLSAGGIVTPIGKKRGGMPRLLMSLKRIYCLCMLCCLCIHIISACMDACICMHCGPEWTSCCALHCMARSLARLVETRN